MSFARCILILGLVSLGTAIMLPSFGVDQGVHAGDWQGVFSQKNVLGRIMSLGVVLSMTMPFRRFKTALSATLFLLCSLLLIKSGAKTALAVTLLASLIVVLWYMLRCFSALGRLAILCMVIPLLLMVYALMGPDLLLNLLDRDATLTGRTEIWVASVAALKSQWLPLDTGSAESGLGPMHFFLTKSLANIPTRTTVF